MSNKTNCKKRIFISRQVFFLFVTAISFMIVAGSIMSSTYAAPPNMVGRSIIFNDGTDSIDIYLELKVEWWNGNEWNTNDVVYNGETISEIISIAPQETLYLATYFNGKWNTSMAKYGSGLYRVYAAAKNTSTNNIIINSDGSQTVATYNFTITGASATYSKYTFRIKDLDGNTVLNSKVKIYNNTYTFPEHTFNIGLDSTSMDFLNGRKYNLLYTHPAGILLNIFDLTINKNSTITPYFGNYTGYVPSRFEQKSPIVVLNDSDLNYDSINITFPINGTVSTVNVLYHCGPGNWNYATKNCTNWESIPLSSRQHSIEGQKLTVNVQNFDAHIVGTLNCPDYTRITCVGGTESYSIDSDGCVIEGTGVCTCPSGTTLSSGSCVLISTPSPDNGGGGGGGGAQPPKDNKTVTYSTEAKITTHPQKIKLSIGGSHEFDILVKNTGKSELKDIFIESNSPWLIFDKSAFTLAVNDTRTISMNLSIPASVNAGPYSVTIYVKNSNGVLDTVTFPVMVVEEEGVDSVSMIDTEIVRNLLEDVIKRIDLFSNQGYNVTSAKSFADTAQAYFEQGDFLTASDYVSLANDALNKREELRETQTYLVSYIIFGVIFSLLILLYYFYSKYKSEKMESPTIENQLQTEKNEKVTKPEKKPVQKVQNTEVPPTDDTDDMIQKLNELKKRVEK